MNQHTLTLNDYQVANLRALLEATGIYTFPEKRAADNPLFALDTGDWLAEIYQMLPKVSYKPNQTPAEQALGVRRRAASELVLAVHKAATGT